MANMTDQIPNERVREALRAFQSGNTIAWLSNFTDDAKLFDDGNPRSLKSFSAEAIGHEKFVTIDKVENGGLEVYGHFRSDEWGDFHTYFKFHLRSDGKKFDRLEIGQT